jgi:hypothetical protein
MSINGRSHFRDHPGVGTDAGFQPKIAAKPRAPRVVARNQGVQP